MSHCIITTVELTCIIDNLCFLRQHPQIYDDALSVPSRANGSHLFVLLRLYSPIYPIE
jgi:hypothetical protein